MGGIAVPVRDKQHGTGCCYGLRHVGDRGRYFRTPNPWQQDEERIERVVAARRAELEQMRGYLTHDGCLMEYLTRLLDDPEAGPCGRCSNDRGKGLPREVDPVLVREATRFLRRDLRAIEPRRQWPAGAVPGLSGRIQPSNEQGVALCVYGDAGWGREVARGKYVDGRFSDELVHAAAAAIRDRWGAAPPMRWVTAIPATSRGSLMGDLAAALAGELGLPYVDCLSALVDGESQKTMLNSVQQLRNAHRKLDVDAPTVSPGAVLLVDDVVDSGWTLTYSGWLLRTHGSGPVYPFALAVATHRDS